MTAYLEAAEAGDDAAYKDYMRAHAQAVRSRVRELGQKAYWSQFEKAPEVQADEFILSVYRFLPIFSGCFLIEPGLIMDYRFLA